MLGVLLCYTCTGLGALALARFGVMVSEDISIGALHVYGDFAAHSHHYGTSETHPNLNCHATLTCSS